MLLANFDKLLFIYCKICNTIDRKYAVRLHIYQKGHKND